MATTSAMRQLIDPGGTSAQRGIEENRRKQKEDLNRLLGILGAAKTATGIAGDVSGLFSARSQRGMMTAQTERLRDLMASEAMQRDIQKGMWGEAAKPGIASTVPEAPPGFGPPAGPPRPGAGLTAEQQLEQMGMPERVSTAMGAMDPARRKQIFDAMIAALGGAPPAFVPWPGEKKPGLTPEAAETRSAESILGFPEAAGGEAEEPGLGKLLFARGDEPTVRTSFLSPVREGPQGEEVERMAEPGIGRMQAMRQLRSVVEKQFDEMRAEGVSDDVLRREVVNLKMAAKKQYEGSPELQEWAMKIIEDAYRR